MIQDYNNGFSLVAAEVDVAYQQLGHYGWISSIFAITYRVSPLTPLFLTCTITIGICVLQYYEQFDPYVSFFHCQLCIFLALILISVRVWITYKRYEKCVKTWSDLCSYCRDTSRKCAIWVDDEHLAVDIVKWIIAIIHTTKDTLKFSRELTNLEKVQEPLNINPENIEALRDTPRMTHSSIMQVSELVSSAYKRNLIDEKLCISIDHNLTEMLKCIDYCQDVVKNPISVSYLIVHRLLLFLLINLAAFFTVGDYHWFSILFAFGLSYFFYSLEEICSDFETPFKDSYSKVCIAKIKDVTIDIQNIVIERAVFWEKSQQERDRRKKSLVMDDVVLNKYYRLVEKDHPTDWVSIPRPANYRSWAGRVVMVTDTDRTDVSVKVVDNKFDEIWVPPTLLVPLENGEHNPFDSNQQSILQQAIGIDGMDRDFENQNFGNNINSNNMVNAVGNGLLMQQQNQPLIQQQQPHHVMRNQNLRDYHQQQMNHGFSY